MLRYNLDAPVCSFFIQANKDNETHWQLRYWLENVPSEFVLDSFGIRIAQIENSRAFLRNGYYSWDGTEYVSADVSQSVTGYAMTQLLSPQGTENLVLGFDRHDRFQQTYTFEHTDTQTSLTLRPHEGRLFLCARELTVESSIRKQLLFLARRGLRARRKLFHQETCYALQPILRKKAR